ncbi:MAG: hypothetical protein ACKPKO_18635, partial [Candidatus Fonsibacter sp.]
SIRHLAQTLGNAERLDAEYHKYAAGQESPMPAAAWIAQAMCQQAAPTSVLPSTRVRATTGWSSDVVRKALELDRYG